MTLHSIILGQTKRSVILRDAKRPEGSLLLSYPIQNVRQSQAATLPADTLTRPQ